MTNGYAKPVLVTTGWPADRLDEPELVIAEVDENADLYDEGHIPGAVKLHWRDDLHDAVERDIVDRETCEGVLGDRGIGNDAVSIPWASAVGDDGTFKGADELRELYGDKGVTPEQEVTYCRIGERWAHTWFVVRELLGYESVRNHDGSWTEWGNLVDVPIERGA